MSPSTGEFGFLMYGSGALQQTFVSFRARSAAIPGMFTERASCCREMTFRIVSYVHRPYAHKPYTHTRPSLSKHDLRTPLVEIVLVVPGVLREFLVVAPRR